MLRQPFEFLGNGALDQGNADFGFTSVCPLVLAQLPAGEKDHQQGRSQRHTPVFAEQQHKSPCQEGEDETDAEHPEETPIAGQHAGGLGVSQR